VEGLERAKADLNRGDARAARDRLKGLVGTYPECIELRTLLAESYRRDRQWNEAGRWGYLVGSAASEREREAFERHCAFGWKSRITEARLRHLLRAGDLAAIADATGRALLRELPHKRNPWRTDGPFAAVSRKVAALRSRRSWR